jgi:plastocyanin
LVVGSGGEITDVVVRLVDVAGAPAYPDRGPALIDQKGCVFVPHVTVIAPGQELVARNSDPVLHNFRTITKSNRTVNKAQVKGKQDTFRFDSAEILSVECDVHYWMSAVIVVADSAFVAVTGKDGSYRIDGVPPAAYTVEFWHQQLGSRRAMVDVTAEGGRLDLSWDAAP